MDDIDSNLVEALGGGSGGAKRVAVGENHKACIAGDGGLWTWWMASQSSADSRTEGQLGHGDRLQSRRPRRVAAREGVGGVALRWIGVACGRARTHAVDDGGALYSWGSLRRGCLGLPPDLPSAGAGGCVCVPERVALPPVGQVFAGPSHSLALARDSGAAFSWGEGADGKLGHGHCEDVALPRQVALPVDAAASGSSRPLAHAACGATHSLLVTASGRVLAFGSNADGQCGPMEEEDGSCLVLRPTAVPSAALRRERVLLAACGDAHSAVLTAAGDVWTWGTGRAVGRPRSERLAPGKVRRDAGARFTALACGAGFTAALDSGGGLWTWGDGDRGQLGHSGYTRTVRTETTEEQNPSLGAPRRIQAGALAGDSKCVALAAGYEHCMAVVQAPLAPSDVALLGGGGSPGFRV